MPKGSPVFGAHYLARGFQLILNPKFRWFILVPLLINFIIFLVATAVLIHYFHGALDWIASLFPDWSWLSWFKTFMVTLLWPVFAAVLMIVYGYSFSILSNLIAAPFNGLLAEKIENHLLGYNIDSEPLSQMIPRTLLRELLKLWYFISRGLLILIISFFMIFIPLVNVLIPVVGILWSAWCLALQYGDYPADNHKTSFKRLRNWMGSAPLTSYTFGGLILMGAMVPILNIFVMPIAVAGATVYWVEQGREAILGENDHS